MSQQKQQMKVSLTKLQGLTADYTTILEAEKRTETMRNETQKTSAQIDIKLTHILKETDRLNALQLNIERTMMENEDQAS